MSRDEFIAIIKKLWLAYTAFDMTDDQVGFWYEMFSWCGKELFESAVLNYIATSPYVPTIAGITACINTLRTAPPVNWTAHPDGGIWYDGKQLLGVAPIK